MTIHEAKLLQAFNAWASQKIFDAVAALPPEQFTREMKASHGSIRGTLAHLVTSDQTWLARLTGTPGPPAKKPGEVPALADLRTTWGQTGFGIARWLGTMTDARLQDTFTMTTADGKTYTHTFAQALQHMIDHGSYHRGQVVTLLRQLGVTPPSTGMIRFFREAAKVT